MDKLITLFFILLALPFVISAVAQLGAALIATILPLFLFLAVVMGFVAGATAGLILLRRLPSLGRGRAEEAEFPVPPPEGRFDEVPLFVEGAGPE